MTANAQIFVANLSPLVTQDDLKRVFAVYGAVSEIQLLVDRVNGHSRGLAFVTMESSAQAQAAMNELNGTDLHGSALVLNLAKPRRDRAQRRSSGAHHPSYRRA